MDTESRTAPVGPARKASVHVEDSLQRPDRTAFLVGAGISVGFPSCLPTAESFLRELFKKICPAGAPTESLADLLGTLIAKRETADDFIRFETVMAILSIQVDPDLSVLKVFSQCKTPNAHHFFLTEMLAHGSIVLTTNFDNLIEHACRERGVAYDLVLQEQDFEKFLAEGRSSIGTLIKLHGGYDGVPFEGGVLPGATGIKATTFQPFYAATCS